MRKPILVAKLINQFHDDHKWNNSLNAEFKAPSVSIEAAELLEILNGLTQNLSWRKNIEDIERIQPTCLIGPV